MTTVVRARLRGPDSLVWPVEPGYSPEWMPNYGDFEGEFGTPEAQAVVKAYQQMTPLDYGKQTWYVESLEWYVESLDIDARPE